MIMNQFRTDLEQELEILWPEDFRIRTNLFILISDSYSLDIKPLNNLLDELENNIGGLYSVIEFGPRRAIITYQQKAEEL